MRSAISFIAVTTGSLLIYSGFKNVNIWDTVVDVINGNELKGVKGNPTPLANGTASNTNSGDTVNAVAGSTYGDIVTNANNVASGGMVSIGYNGHKLNPKAAKGYSSAVTMFGRQIPVTDSYRTYAQQADLYARKPTLAAKPGSSQHELGNAIDVHTGLVNPNDPRLVASLTAAGWCRYAPVKEPWHWSYQTCK